MTSNPRRLKGIAPLASDACVLVFGARDECEPVVDRVSNGLVIKRNWWLPRRTRRCPKVLCRPGGLLVRPGHCADDEHRRPVVGTELELAPRGASQRAARRIFACSVRRSAGIELDCSWRHETAVRPSNCAWLGRRPFPRRRWDAFTSQVIGRPSSVRPRQAGLSCSLPTVSALWTIVGLVRGPCSWPGWRISWRGMHSSRPCSVLPRIVRLSCSRILP